MADDQNQDADENARNQAALAAYDDQQRKLRTDYAAFMRQRKASGNAGQASPRGRGGGWQQSADRLGPPPPPPHFGVDAPQPAPPQFATDTAAALTAASQAMQAIAASIGDRAANNDRNSRGRDGDIVVSKDISQVFDEVPEEILERVRYVKRLENRLHTNTSGIRLKFDSENILSIRVSDDAEVATNFRMYEYKNVDMVVPFAVVFF